MVKKVMFALSFICVLMFCVLKIILKVNLSDAIYNTLLTSSLMFILLGLTLFIGEQAFGGQSER